MICTGIGSKATVHNCLNKLEKIGLIQKAKTSRGNNIYVVYKPLDKASLYKCVPEKVVSCFKEHEAKILNIAESDKGRLKQYKQNQLEQERGNISKIGYS